MKYTKLPLSLEEQLQHLKTQYNIECEDDEFALFYLKHHNYYRLRGYWFYFEKKKIKTSFKNIINLYNFDNELRLLFTKYISFIEISIKSNFAYLLTMQHKNSHPILNKLLFKNEKFYNNGVEKLRNSFINSDELFAIHYKKNYDEYLPPFWVCVEFMTFGELSKWINNLNDKDTKLIAKEYNLKSPYIFRSFLYHLTEIRNKCAHHSRIWNKSFSHKFEIPKQFKEFFDKNFYKLSHTLLVMKILLKPLKQDNFTKKVLQLANNYNIPIKEMGLNEITKKVLQ